MPRNSVSVLYRRAEGRRGEERDAHTHTHTETSRERDRGGGEGLGGTCD